MVLKRKLPTDNPTPAGVPDAAPQQAQERKPEPPPLPTSFDNFEEIPDTIIAAEPRPLGGPLPETAKPAPAPVQPTPAAPISSGGLKRRMPAPAAAPAQTEPAAPALQQEPQRAAPMLDDDPLVADPFVAEETTHYAAAPEPIQTLAQADTDDLGWMNTSSGAANDFTATNAANDEWEMGVEPDPTFNSGASSADAPVYGNLGRADDPFAAAPVSNKTTDAQRPWEQTGSSNMPPPTLPKNSFAGAKSEGHGRSIITVGLIGVLGLGAYMFINNRDSAVDAMSRWTGTLSGVSQNLADTPGENAKGLIPTDEVISSKDVGIAPLQPAFGDQMAKGDALPEPILPADKPNTAVDFVDVPPSQGNDPIVADGSETMPDEVSAFAALHEAIMERRAERDAKKAARKGAATGEDLPPPLGDTPAEDRPRFAEDVDRDLAAYRRVLASIDNPGDKPSPGEFFDNPSAYDSGLLPPPGSPAEKPTKTPEGNPIIASEVQRTTAEKSVRTLADFEDALMKQPEKQVRIPSKVKPRLATSGFPELEILSLIPTYGLLANASDRQGVLLIGDTFEGWELIGVYDTYAEFQSGDRKHVVTLQ